MTPFYQDDYATIYCGDCKYVLGELSQMACFMADITVSSPPYNQISETSPSGMLKEHNHKQNAGYASHSDDLPEHKYQEWMREIFQMCAGISKGLVWINHKTRFREKSGIHPLQIFPWSFYSEIIWDRGGSITLNARKFAPSHEVIYGFGTPHYWDNQLNTTMSVWRINPETTVKGHPCPFPVVIPSRIISASCPAGGIVLDPFAGSGTTLVAAKQLGRKSIGIEKDPSYCEIAANRLRNEPNPLFTHEPTQLREQELKL